MIGYFFSISLPTKKVQALQYEDRIDEFTEATMEVQDLKTDFLFKELNWDSLATYQVAEGYSGVIVCLALADEFNVDILIVKRMPAFVKHDSDARVGSKFREDDEFLFYCLEL